MDRPRLFGTPLSHFTRKIRILLSELGVEFDFVRPAGVLTTSSTDYGGNPLLRVPAFVDGPVTVIDSDHIARYLVGKHDAADRLGVCSVSPEHLNRVGVVNGIMANEVVLILAKRAGLDDLARVAYFRKLETAITSGLGWLDAHTEPDAPGFGYADIATICMWQHVQHYELADGLEAYSRIAARVARFAERASVATTTPAASLADAAAAGWAQA